MTQGTMIGTLTISRIDALDPFKYQVTGADGLRLRIEISSRSNGEWVVASSGAGGGPQMSQLHRGAHPLKVVREAQGAACDLLQTRVSLGSLELYSRRKPVSVDELTAGAGVDLLEGLRQFGSVSVGSRAELNDDKSPAQSVLTALFDVGSTVPVGVFLLTRVLPLKNMYCAQGAAPGLPDYRPPTSAVRDRRVYVIALEDVPNPRYVYVGETGASIEERFRQHKTGYRSSRWVRRLGVRLLPELYEQMPTYRTTAESEDAEARHADELSRQGYTVESGPEHRAKN